MTLQLAPLHGVTNRVFRKAYFRRFKGFDAALAPFITSTSGDRVKESRFKDLAPDAEVAVPLVPQILGNDAASFVSTAKMLASLGYTEVNWNLGCPYPMVAKKGRGSGLLPHPERIARFLDEACPLLEIPLSLKVRLGRYDAAELLALMPILNAYPLKRIIIHPRIGTQMYKGEVDLDGFERAAGLSAHTIVYNGDIKDAATFERLRRRFPSVDGWMIGRWALYDPFLPGRIKGLDPVVDPLGEVRAFHDELYADYRAVLCGPAHALDKMKEVWTFLRLSISGVASAFAGLERTKTFGSYEREVRAVFAEGVWTK